MPDVMFLLPTMQHANWLHEKFDAGLLRASAHVMSGEYQGLGFASLDNVTSGDTVRMSTCDPTQVPCLMSSILPITDVLNSHMPPYDCILFILVEVAAGSRRAFAKRLRGVESPQGVEVAASHLMEHRDYHVVVEIGGDDADQVFTHALELVDHETVVRSSTLVTTRERTRGFGGQSAS